MSTHAIHDDIEESGLDPRCPRCVELAEDPVMRLDNENLLRILGGDCYSDLDREAKAKMSWISERYERMQEAVRDVYGVVP